MRTLDALLDRSVIFSFDQGGFARHARDFQASDLDRDLSGRLCLVTGANSGLGLATARGLAARGATLLMACRDPLRGAAAREAVAEETGNAAVHLGLVDLSSLASVRTFVARLDEAFGTDASRLDLIVHNAGVLPDHREITAEGLERTVATHVVGPHVMTALLTPRLHDARVIFVSSGGMYAKRFSMDRMLPVSGRYDGVAAYAMTKRAQVILTERWAEALAPTSVVHAMHPGWAATPGVERSLPRFFSRLRHRLRSPEEGADTILYLAMAPEPGRTTGRFWFDRRVAPTHLLPFTRERPEERQRLWDFCQGYLESPQPSAPDKLSEHKEHKEHKEHTDA